MPRLVPFIIGIVVGYGAAAIITAIGHIFDIDYFLVVNFDPIVSNFVNADGSFVGIKAFFDYPRLALFEAAKEIKNGTHGINAGSAVEIIIAFLPVALVVFAEHIADHKNLSSIIGHDLIKNPGLKNTLLGDGVGSMAGTVFGICPNTTYGESVGCVAITRSASVATITTTAFMRIAIAFFKPLMVILQTIPSCIMGGVCLTLYGFIAVSGLKMIQKVDLEQNANLFTASVILIAGIGGLALNFGPVTITSIACALILGILTNLMVNKSRR
jgi:uracil permease